MRPPIALALLALLACACRPPAVRSDDPTTTGASSDAGASDPGDSGLTASEPNADAATALADGGDWAGPKIAALESPTPIFSKMEWPAKDPSKGRPPRMQSRLTCRR